MLVFLLACEPTALVIDPPEDTAPEPEPGRVLVNELDAVGGDWLELYNPTSTDVDLDEWTVRTDASDAHTLEHVTVPAGGHLVLYADGDPSLGPDHLGFKLSGDGGALFLADPGGVEHTSLSWPAQARKVVAARTQDGADTWVLTTDDSPGEANPAREVPAPTGDDSDCGLSFEGSGDVTEGETIEVTASCREPAELELLVGPDDATFQDGVLVWETDSASASNTFAVIGATTSSDRIPEAGEIALDVTDAPELGGPEVDPETYTHEWGLPVVHLTTDEDLSQSYQTGTLTYMGRTWVADIKIRGATSASFPKPSLTLEFNDDEVEIEGWDRSRNHLVLLSTFDDNAYVRQKMVYDTWAALAAYDGVERLTPRTWFTVAYLNGEYFGLYVGLDKVDDEFCDHAGLNRDGNLYKAVNHDANFSLVGSSGGAKTDLAAGYEKKEGDPEDDFSDLQALVQWVGASEAQTIVDEGAEHFDYDEFMDWWLLVATTLAEDSAGKNSYLYNDPLSPGWRFVPWDFNASYGQNWYTGRRDVTGINEFQSSNRIFWAMLNADEDVLKARLLERLDDGGPLDAETQLGWMDAWYEQIDRSAQRDWAKWEESYRGHWWNAYRSDWNSYEEEVDYLYDWVLVREETMRSWAER